MLPARRKETNRKLKEYSVLHKACSRAGLLTEPNLLGFYQILTYLEDMKYPMKALSSPSFPTQVEWDSGSQVKVTDQGSGLPKDRDLITGVQKVPFPTHLISTL
jgi:hypothetical protein